MQSRYDHPSLFRSYELSTYYIKCTLNYSIKVVILSFLSLLSCLSPSVLVCVSIPSFTHRMVVLPRFHNLLWI